MELQDRMYAKKDIETVIGIASTPDWHLDKAHAIYELAFRALTDQSLLHHAWRLIGNEISIVTRQGPPLGQPAAALLLDSKVDGIEQSLVQALESWSQKQQADFFFALFPKEERFTFFERLKRQHGFKPKMEISESGDILRESN